MNISSNLFSSSEMRKRRKTFSMFIHEASTIEFPFVNPLLLENSMRFFPLAKVRS